MYQAHFEQSSFDGIRRVRSTSSWKRRCGHSRQAPQVMAPTDRDGHRVRVTTTALLLAEP